MRVLKKELWPYKVPIKASAADSKIIEIETWLLETMGEYKGKYSIVYKHDSTDFYFREGKDATFFILRWS